MNGRQDVDSEKVCDRNGHLVSGDYQMAEGGENPGQSHIVWGLANSASHGQEISESRESPQTRMAEGPQADVEPDGINPHDLPYVILSESHYLPRASGVYFGLEGDKVTYIGKSKNIRKRWRGHCALGELYDFSSVESMRRVRVAWVNVSVDKLDDVERRLIQRFRPQLNKAYIEPEEKRTSKSGKRVYTASVPAHITKLLDDERKRTGISASEIIINALADFYGICLAKNP